MKRATIVLSVLVVIACSTVALFKYEQWFVYPVLRAHVNDHLRDPLSTQYRKEFMTEFGWLCGELNSKNGSGGYAGFKRYLARGAADAYLEGVGAVGREETTDEMIKRLKRQYESLKLAKMSYGNAFRTSHPISVTRTKVRTMAPL